MCKLEEHMLKIEFIIHLLKPYHFLSNQGIYSVCRITANHSFFTNPISTPDLPPITKNNTARIYILHTQQRLFYFIAAGKFKTIPFGILKHKPYL